MITIHEGVHTNGAAPISHCRLRNQGMGFLASELAFENAENHKKIDLFYGELSNGGPQLVS